MSIIIDLGGNSTSTHIIGLMVHLIANMDDGLCPHSTTLKTDIWQLDRHSVDSIILGKLECSKYVNAYDLPAYLSNHVIPANVHKLVISRQTDTHSKQHLLSLLAAGVYGQMVMRNGERWSSSVNCQQFSHHFVVDALGLEWPTNLDIAGDVLPVSIDIGIL
ncbi:unnamed protein product [Adineta ricciae]|uniref:Uncharacterized protein n=1 Tax=Adineta ricciae TaxID=249248 RepID=A0A815RQV0_ADIRI|nr:unnamed protein product [Adineta ricciae]